MLHQFMEDLVQSIYELILTGKHRFLSMELKLVNRIKALPWLHIDWVVKLESWKMELEAKLKTITERLWGTL